jgi:O-acetyl-ADP-ribose deacetylase (regulator of RNase III)
MTRRDTHGVTIECVQGDIANQPDTEAIVNAANAELRIGGGAGSHGAQVVIAARCGLG